ncbi:unnamed protein product [Acanthosepion pharaonis]|uniref:Uncharacterized protein n=1 Tax=Acanthosepion pharaonis TaxID=158019 RepID=A0A812AYD9_ACAPH|nr:unnamed protein product [Sepia pharaonis]
MTIASPLGPPILPGFHPVAVSVLKGPSWPLWPYLRRRILWSVVFLFLPKPSGVGSPRAPLRTQTLFPLWHRMPDDSVPSFPLVPGRSDFCLNFQQRRSIVVFSGLKSLGHHGTIRDVVVSGLIRWSRHHLIMYVCRSVVQFDTGANFYRSFAVDSSLRLELYFFFFFYLGWKFFLSEGSFLAAAFRQSSSSSTWAFLSEGSFLAAGPGMNFNFSSTFGLSAAPILLRLSGNLLLRLLGLEVLLLRLGLEGFLV